MSNPNLKKIIKLTQTQYDILSNGGTVGDYTGLNDNYLYLIQSDSPDLPVVGSGDKNKVLHTNASTGSLEWSGNYVDLTSDQTISGNKMYTGIISTKRASDTDANAWRFQPYAGNGLDIKLGTTQTGVKVWQYAFRPLQNGVLSLGEKNYKWTDVFLSGGLRDGNNDNYKLILPDSTSWTANKTIATTDQIPTVNDGTLTVQAEGTTKGTFTANQSTNTTINITKDDFVQSRTYTGLIGTSNEYKNAGFYFLEVMPASWDVEWSIKYRIEAHIDDGLTPTNYQFMTSVHECYLGSSHGMVQNWAFFNSISNTSYRTIYYNLLQQVTEEGYNNDYPHLIGVELTSAYERLNVNYKRTVKITVIETTNCTVEFLDEPKIPSMSTRTDYVKLNATYYPTAADNNTPGGAWRGVLYNNGMQEASDDNTVNRLYYNDEYHNISSTLGVPGYSIIGFDSTGNVNSISLPSADFSTGSSYAISTTRVYNTNGFDWSRGLAYYTSSGFLAASSFSKTNYNRGCTSIDLRYSDNVNNANNTTLTIVGNKDFYFRGIIGSDGFFYLAPMEVTYNNQTYKRAWTQDIPTTEDGYVYWLLGTPYNSTTYTTAVSVHIDNGLYWFKDGKFREYDPGYTGIKRFI